MATIWSQQPAKRGTIIISTLEIRKQSHTNNFKSKSDQTNRLQVIAFLKTQHNAKNLWYLMPASSIELFIQPECNKHTLFSRHCVYYPVSSPLKITMLGKTVQ